MDNSFWQDQYPRANKAFIEYDFATGKELGEEVRKDRIRNGFVKAEPFMKWIKKEWLEKGLSEGAIAYRGGQYYPRVDEVESEVITGHRGRTPIIEKIKKIDASKVIKFINEYKVFIDSYRGE